MNLEGDSIGFKDERKDLIISMRLESTICYIVDDAHSAYPNQDTLILHDGEGFP